MVKLGVLLQPWLLVRGLDQIWYLIISILVRSRAWIWFRIFYVWWGIQLQERRVCTMYMHWLQAHWRTGHSSHWGQVMPQMCHSRDQSVWHGVIQGLREVFCRCSHNPNALAPRGMEGVLDHIGRNENWTLLTLVTAHDIWASSMVVVPPPCQSW